MADSTDGKLYATLAQTPTHGHRHILYGRDSFDENDRPESRHGVEAQITAQPATLIQEGDSSFEPSRCIVGPPEHLHDKDQFEPSDADLSAEKLISPSRSTDSDKRNGKSDEIDTPIEESDESSTHGSGGKVEGSSSSPPIKYILSYRDSGSIFKDETVDNIESLEPTLDQQNRQEEAILEVTRIVYIETMRKDYTISLEQQNLKLKSYGPCQLRINSTAIIQALAFVVDYWPGINLNSSSLTVEEPFAILYQHREALQDYAKTNVSATDQNDERCQRKRYADPHVKLLFEFLDIRPEARKMHLERERYNRSKPVATFEMLWMLFSPGTDVFHNADGFGSFKGYVVKRASGGGLDVSNASPFTITLWCLDFNGSHIGRVELGVQIQPFRGEKEISTLNVIPCDFYERDTAGQVSDKSKALRQRLENYGEMFLKLTERHCVDYSGELYEARTRPYSGRVVIDTEGYYHKGYNGPPSLEALKDDEIISPPECTCSNCNANRQINNSSIVCSQFSQYDLIRPVAADFRGLTKHQKFVCKPRVFGFALDIREWLCLQIANIKECQWNTSLIDKQLSLNNGTRDMIKCLVQRYTLGLGLKNGSSEQWSADFIMDKGDSQIFLLHGPPGVGKTFTAECVAEFVQRPLLSVNCSDIGVDVNQVESQVRGFFKMAKLWGAVVLLDEADVYLEQRTAQDLQRNCVVAAFLRSLEYFKGVLFLTTNRVGPFDDALLSRMHIILHYDMDESQRQAIWGIFFQKLERERGRQIKVPYSTREYTRHDPELRALKWNGREIRNAFQTAVALAEHKNECDPEDGLVMLQDEHFKQVVRISANFVGYMQRVRGDAEKYAALRGDRNEC